jgi:hypothetical protein
MRSDYGVGGPDEGISQVCPWRTSEDQDQNPRFPNQKAEKNDLRRAGEKVQVPSACFLAIKTLGASQSMKQRRNAGKTHIIFLEWRAM